MLVQNSIYRNTYLTDGVNKDFYFSFPILESSQVLVQTSLVTNTEVVETVDPSQYTVTGVGLVTGGHISFTTAPPSGSRLALTLNMPITQLYQYAELDSFPAKSHENALAKLTLICQQLKEQIGRAVLVNATSEQTSAELIATLLNAKDNAVASAAEALTSAGNAALSASNAVTSAQNAAASAALAAANSEDLVTEVQNLSTMFIGAVFPLTCADGYVPNGCVPADGGEYTRAQFPSFFDGYLVSGKMLTCSYSAWATQVGITGNCTKFALDTDAQKFRVPLYKDGDSITQASSAAELGKSYKAGLPDIQGTIGAIDYLGKNPTGALYNTGLSVNAATASAPTVKADSNIGIKASLFNSIYGNATTVLDEQVRLRHFVVIASAQNAASVFDWSNYMAGLAGKANTNMTNVTGNAIGYYFYARDEKSAGTGGGTNTAGAWMTRDLNTVVKNNIGASLSSNRITLQPGTYYVEASVPSFCTDFMRGALYDYTNSQYKLYGTSACSGIGDSTVSRSFIRGEITVASAAQFELRMWSNAAYGTRGCGAYVNVAGVNEIYSEIAIWKV